jgi:hypothetical protein
MIEQKLFDKILVDLKFDVTDYLGPELNDFQKKTIEDATFIFKDNIVGAVQSFGGNVKNNEDRFKKFVTQAEKEIEKDEFREIKKELKDYIKKLREVINKSCFSIIPVKDMPWVDLMFRTIPRIIFEKKKITRTTIFGKLKNEDSLFAPVMGDLDLGVYELNEAQEKTQKSRNHSFVSAIIDSLDFKTTRSHLEKYHEGYQRHGDPVSDFLMNNKDLLQSMEKVTSSIESKRLSSESAICGISIPLLKDKTSLTVVVNESEKQQKFSDCFEAFLKFSAACCQAPLLKEEQSASVAPSSSTGQLTSTQSGGMRTPGGQELKVWSEEELAQQAQQRGGGIPADMGVWSEEELEKMVKERGSGLPEGMEVWTEEELGELAKKRQGGGLDIPEWKPDQEMKECSNCGYSLRPEWQECPVCGKTVNSKQTSESNEEKASQTPTQVEDKENH